MFPNDNIYDLYNSRDEVIGVVLAVTALGAFDYADECMPEIKDRVAYVKFRGTEMKFYKEQEICQMRAGRFGDLCHHLSLIRNSPMHNYIVPGLTSWLLGRPDPHTGCVRMFTMERRQDTKITPHSHRFDFQCLVLKGSVQNTLYEQTNHVDAMCDAFQMVELTYLGHPGEYVERDDKRSFFTRNTRMYSEGETYEMKHDEIHSIEFSSDAVVLFFEGAYVTDKSYALLPVVDGEVIRLLKREDWMFRKGDTKKLVPPLNEGMG